MESLVHQYLYSFIYNYPLLALITGLIIWLFGWRIYKLAMIPIGAVFGILFALHTPYLHGVSNIVLIGGGALIGAALGYFIHYLILFSLGVAIGFDLVIRTVGQHAEIIGIFIGIAVGMSLIVLFKIAVVVVTSYIGAVLMTNSLIILLGYSLSWTVKEIVVLLITAAGVVMQYQVWGEPSVTMVRKEESK